MTSIRKYAYAGLLAFTTLGIGPTVASAQEAAHGQFSLPHEVHWQNAVVPAGDYQFSLETNGASGMLTLSKTSDARGGFMILVNDIDDFSGQTTNQLVLDRTANGSYVRTLELPKFGIALHFPVPGAPGPVTASAAAGK